MHNVHDATTLKPTDAIIFLLFKKFPNGLLQLILAKSLCWGIFIMHNCEKTSATKFSVFLHSKFKIVLKGDIQIICGPRWKPSCIKCKALFVPTLNVKPIVSFCYLFFFFISCFCSCFWLCLWIMPNIPLCYCLTLFWLHFLNCVLDLSFELSFIKTCLVLHPPPALFCYRKFHCYMDVAGKSSGPVATTQGQLLRDTQSQEPVTQVLNTHTTSSVPSTGGPIWVPSLPDMSLHVPDVPWPRLYAPSLPVSSCPYHSLLVHGHISP